MTICEVVITCRILFLTVGLLTEVTDSPLVWSVTEELLVDCFVFTVP